MSLAFCITEISGKWFRLIVTGDLIPWTEGNVVTEIINVMGWGKEVVLGHEERDLTEKIKKKDKKCQVCVTLDKYGLCSDVWFYTRNISQKIQIDFQLVLISRKCPLSFL